MEALQELLTEELQDLLHAENQLVKALPKMAKAAHAAELKEAFSNHLKQTQEHVERLKRAFGILEVKAKAKPCKGMVGLIEEGQEVITEGKGKDAEIADLALIAAAQKVEHYEISGYGTLRTIAERLGQDEVAQLLAETLEEEKKADELLTSVAQSPLESTSESADEEGGESEEMSSTPPRSRSTTAKKKAHA